MAAIPEIIELIVEAIEGTLDVLGEELAEEVVAELAAYQETVAETVTEMMESGASDSEVLGDVYDNLYAINEDLADQWMTQVEESGEYEVGSSPEEAETADFEDADPESDPDKGDVNTINCQNNPELPECVEGSENRVKKFIEWVKEWGGILANASMIIYQLIGKARIYICKKTCSGTEEECDKKCNTEICNNTKNFVKSLRKYYYLIVIMILATGGGTAYYTKNYTSTMMYSGIMLLVVTILSGIGGNIFTTIVCNTSAVTGHLG